MEVANEDYKNLSRNNIQSIIKIINRIKDYADVSNWDDLVVLDSDAGIDDDRYPYFNEYKGLEVSIKDFSDIEIKIIKKFKEDLPILEYEKRGKECFFYLSEDFYESYEDYKEFLVELSSKRAISHTV